MFGSELSQLEGLAGAIKRKVSVAEGGEMCLAISATGEVDDGGKGQTTRSLQNDASTDDPEGVSCRKLVDLLLFGCRR